MIDPRPAGRVIDVQAMRRFHMEMHGEPCQRCERRPGTQIHHTLYRSRGGGDVRDNFEWVCVYCQDDAHS